MHRAAAGQQLVRVRVRVSSVLAIKVRVRVRVRVSEHTLHDHTVPGSAIW